MRLSIVIATAERTELLRQTLASLAACLPPPEEIVVVDGDPDRSAEHAAAGRYGDISIHYLTAPRSSTTQRNMGIDSAAGDVVVFVDDDVTLEPGALQQLAAAFADADVAGASGRVLEAASRRVGGQRSRLRARLLGSRDGTFTRFGYPRYLQAPDRAVDVQFMPGCFMAARRDLAAEVRFDEAMGGYALAEDEDFSYRLSRLGRLRHVPTAIVHHHKTGFRSQDSRAFGRRVVQNRTYLFRKNFPQTARARAEFALFLLVLVGHRLANRDWPGARGLVEGAVTAWRNPRPSA